MTACRRILLPVVSALMLSIAIVSVRAASPMFWRVSTQAEFLRGDAENVSVVADGRLLLGPNAETVHEIAAPFVWSLVAGPDAVWIGSGDDGVVSRITPDGAVAIEQDRAIGDAPVR